ncbi:MAG: hypothetical protein JWR83_1990, partial [Aeromicrobium sp.]|nr:hypothetical protein [Aeromicrobium sp.]
SGTRDQNPTDQIAYAPTALTGFAVSFIIDNPNNGGERTTLKLNPRLLAKLLTQSYTGSSLGAQHPGMATNPLSVNLDPEFQALNPGLDTFAREAAATVLSMSDSSDVIKTLTTYIADDPEAQSFIEGNPDPWGMVVNPSYANIKLPVSEYPLLDQFVPTSAQECLIQNPAPYFGELAAPVNTFAKIAEALLDAWPNTQTKCDGAGNASEPFKVGRIDRQGIGTRFMLGIVSLGDAARFGLRTASLQTSSTASQTKKITDDSGRTFVTPTTKSILAAVRTAKNQGVNKAFSLNLDRVLKAPGAYPGTMVVYTTAKTSGLKKSEATKVAQFIRTATTEGQVSGSGNGKLPDGFVPILRTGVTAPLFAQAQKVAALIAAQKGDGAAGGPSGTSAPAGTTAPGSTAPDKSTATSASPPASETAKLTSTAAHSSGAAGVLLPLLIVLALLAGLANPATRLIMNLRARR